MDNEVTEYWFNEVEDTHELEDEDGRNVDVLVGLDSMKVDEVGGLSSVVFGGSTDTTGVELNSEIVSIIGGSMNDVVDTWNHMEDETEIIYGQSRRSGDKSMLMRDEL